MAARILAQRSAYSDPEEAFLAGLLHDVGEMILLNGDPRGFETVIEEVELRRAPLIEKEKEVIIEEINSYRDNPAELIFDDFEEIVFHDQPIGRNILGKPETVRTFNRRKILSSSEKTTTLINGIHLCWKYRRG